MKQDKEPGYCIIKRDEVMAAHLSLLENEQMYKEVADWIPPYVYSGYQNLATRIAKFEQDPGLRRQICRSLEVKNASVAARLITTVKTHKPPGDVRLRNVHGLSRYAFGGLGRYVHLKLEVLMKKHCPHLMRSTAEWVQAVKNLKLTKDTWMVRVDLKDFFMSGDAQTLAKNCALCMELEYGQNAARLIEDSVLQLCEYQYVSSSEVSGRLWRVTRGSGMGLPHSGAVSDATLWWLGERQWATNKHIQAAHSVDGWWRFRDDIFILGRDMTKMRSFLNGFRERIMSVYKMEVEAASRSCVDFLAVEVRIKNGRLVTLPREKPSGAPLSNTSAHPPGVARWPIHVLRARLALCNDSQDHTMVKAKFIRRFTDSFASGKLIDTLKATRLGSPALPKEVESGRWWLKIPWHPGLNASRLAFRLREFCASAVWQQAFRFGTGQNSPSSIGIAWRNGFPNMSERIYRSQSSH